MYNSKYNLHPLSLHPGGSRLTFIHKSGKIYKTPHSRVKYVSKYCARVINESDNIGDPVTFIVQGSSVIYEKN